MLKPGIVIYSFNPIAGLARRVVNKPISGICNPARTTNKS
ncbi:hypothetical protein UT300005_18020 [Clostridium sp. CTA-5]